VHLNCRFPVTIIALQLPLAACCTVSAALPFGAADTTGHWA
jgi:hypothetical protein